MNVTKNFNFGYFQEGDSLDETVEKRRWESLDQYLHSLGKCIGDVIIDGWEIIKVHDKYYVSKGKAFISGVYFETSNNHPIYIVEGKNNIIKAIPIFSSEMNKISFSNEILDTNQGIPIGMINLDGNIINNNSYRKKTYGFKSTIIKDLIRKLADMTDEIFAIRLIEDDGFMSASFNYSEGLKYFYINAHTDGDLFYKKENEYIPIMAGDVIDLNEVNGNLSFLLKPSLKNKICSVNGVFA